MTIQASISLAIDVLEKSVLDMGSAQAPLSLKSITPFDNGSGANQASMCFSDSRTLAASGTENLDLAGVLLSAFNAALTFVTVKAIVILARKTNTNNVVVGPASSNGFLGPFGDATDRISIKPGGMLVITAPLVGWPVTPSTGDLLTVLNSSSGTSVTYDVIILG